MLHPREMQERAVPPPRSPSHTYTLAGQGQGQGGQVPRPLLGAGVGGGGGGECCSLAPSRGDVGARVPGDRRRGPPGSGRAMGRAEARSERQAGAWWHALHVFNVHTRAQIALSV